jgi:hypothetical protein
MMEGPAAMDMHAIDEPRETGSDADRRSAALRQITAEQLLHLGSRQVVYLKSHMCDGEMHFVLYRADGMPLASADDIETAVMLAADRGLEFVAVH